MSEENIFFRRNLPHYQPAHGIFFITFRLADTLPNHIIEKLKKERLEELKLNRDNPIMRHVIHKKYFGRYDAFLDKAEYGPKWLERADIADMVLKALQFYNGSRYVIHCCCIMPNHLHWVIDIGNKAEQEDNARIGGKTDGVVNFSYKNRLRYILSPILHSIKRYTAREANRSLGRNGPFWQHESYDHFVRDGIELERIIRYTVHNPVKAGLAKDWRDWQWTYVDPNFCEGILE